MNNSKIDIKLPSFSTKRLHLLLDKLLKAYEAKGMYVSKSLLPPIAEEQLNKLCGWFPGELPQEIIALYEWRGGQENDAFNEEYPFWFRDNSFSSPDMAKFNYESMMATYGDGAPPEFYDLLKYFFPFASFNGGWYVIPTKGHPFNANFDKPVISVFQGIDIYFYSIEAMVSTCIDWVNHSKYDEDSSFSEEIEKSIWNKYNPNIFETSK